MARNIISEGCIYHPIWVKDLKSNTLTLKYVPVVNKFLEVFPKDIFGVPPKQEINIEIDLPPDNYPILIPPYKMAPLILRN